MYFGKASWGTTFFNGLTFLLEFTSALDFIGDMLVLGELFERHPAWTTLSIYFIVSPFYVSYIPLINFQLTAHRALNKNEQIMTHRIVL